MKVMTIKDPFQGEKGIYAMTACFRDLGVHVSCVLESLSEVKYFHHVKVRDCDCGERNHGRWEDSDEYASLEKAAHDYIKETGKNPPPFLLKRWIELQAQHPMTREDFSCFLQSLALSASGEEEKAQKILSRRVSSSLLFFSSSFPKHTRANELTCTSAN